MLRWIPAQQAALAANSAAGCAAAWVRAHSFSQEGRTVENSPRSVSWHGRKSADVVIRGRCRNLRRCVADGTRGACSVERTRRGLRGPGADFDTRSGPPGKGGGSGCRAIRSRRRWGTRVRGVHGVDGGGNVPHRSERRGSGSNTTARGCLVGNLRLGKHIGGCRTHTQSQKQRLAGLLPLPAQRQPRNASIKHRYSLIQRPRLVCRPSDCPASCRSACPASAPASGGSAPARRHGCVRQDAAPAPRRDSSRRDHPPGDDTG